MTKDQVTELYIAMFQRAPSESEIDYWYNSAQTNGLDIIGLADTMVNSAKDATHMFGLEDLYPQYANYDPNNPDSVKDIISSVYSTIFNKDESQDPDGVNYWTNEVLNGKSVGEVIVGIEDAAKDIAENPDKYQDSFDENTLNQAIEAANAFNAKIDAANEIANNISNIKTDPQSLQEMQDIIKEVKDDDDVSQILDKVDNIKKKVEAPGNTDDKNDNDDLQNKTNTNDDDNDLNNMPSSNPDSKDEHYNNKSDSAVNNSDDGNNDYAYNDDWYDSYDYGYSDGYYGYDYGYDDNNEDYAYYNGYDDGYFDGYYGYDYGLDNLYNYDYGYNDGYYGYDYGLDNLYNYDYGYNDDWYNNYDYGLDNSEYMDEINKLNQQLDNLDYDQLSSLYNDLNNFEYDFYNNALADGIFSDDEYTELIKGEEDIYAKYGVDLKSFYDAYGLDTDYLLS
jgi:hypothetical protein